MPSVRRAGDDARPSVASVRTVRHGLRWRFASGTLALLLVESVGVAALSAVTAPAVLGVDCTGTAVPNNGREYSLAQNIDIGTPTIGIAATIEYTNPNVCTIPSGFAFSLAAASLAPTTTTGWVQPGWRKDQGDTESAWVCEFHNISGQNFIYQGPIGHWEHNYKMMYDSYDKLWDCFVDNTNVVSKGNLGFTSGDFVNAQGESNARYGQIGRVDPGRLLIHNVYFWRGGTWQSAAFEDYIHAECQWPGGVQQCYSDTHYGVDEDGTYDSNLRIWTW